MGLSAALWAASAYEAYVLVAFPVVSSSIWVTAVVVVSLTIFVIVSLSVHSR